VTEWLEHPPLALKVGGSGQLLYGIFQNSQFTQQEMAIRLSSELGKVKGGEEEEWCPSSVTPFSVKLTL